VKEILRIGLQIAEGCGGAPARLVHRDVKRHICWRTVERVKIIDFGWRGR